MRVLIVVAPFGLIEYPHLATSLLKAEVREAGFDCDLRYASIEFARRITFEMYRMLYTIDAQLLIPERLFAHALFGDRIPSWPSYWHEVLIKYESPLHDRMRSPAGTDTRGANVEQLQYEAADFVEEFAASPELGDYDVIGFSTSYGQNCASLALAQAIRARHPDTTLIFGGANCAGGMGEKLLDLFEFIDYVCVEDGDHSFPRFLAQLDAGEEVRGPGIVSREILESARSGGAVQGALSAHHEMVVDLDALPYPDYSDYFASFDFGSDVAAETVGVPMETSRGCWWGQKHQCVFCGLNRNSMDYRSKSPERIDAEVRHLVKTWGVPNVMMTDNIMRRDFTRRVAPLLAAAPDHRQIFFEVKANISKDELRQLREARVLHLQPGIESLSTRVLQIMDKGVDSFKNLQLLKWGKELGLRISWNVLCGLPGETEKDYDEMAALIERIHHIPPPLGFSQITIDRFSPMYMNPERFGIQIQPVRGYRFVYPFPEEDLQDLAYWFSQTSENLRGDETLAVPRYARRAYQAYQIWRRVHTRVDFSYQWLDADTIEVHDTRGVSAGTERKLDAIETRVFEALDARRDLESATAFASGRAGQELSSEQVAAVIDRFREWNWLHEENGRFMVLANRKLDEPAPVLYARLDNALRNQRAEPAAD